MKPTDRKRVCVISFSRIVRDARLLRQIRYLIPHHDLVVVGFGPRPEAYRDDPRLTWREVGAPHTTVAPADAGTPRRALALLRAGRWREAGQRARRALGVRLVRQTRYLGWVAPSWNEHWYWRTPLFQQALAAVREARPHAILANDWNTLPLAARAARTTGARLVFDAHEYAPEEYPGFAWRLKHARAITHLLKKYTPAVDGSVTVCPGIAERYREVFGLDPVVVRNAPEPVSVPPHDTSEDRIRLVHHGGAARLRRLEEFIDVVTACDRRFELHYMLTGSDTAYVRELRQRADARAPGRVFFHDPVEPHQVVAEISRYDLALCYRKPSCFNEKHCLPNKFFESMAAGLAVLSGPSPEMATLIRHYGMGCVTPSYRLEDVIRMLNRLTAAEIQAMRRGAARAAAEIHAPAELEKLVALLARVLDSPRNTGPIAPAAREEEACAV